MKMKKKEKKNLRIKKKRIKKEIKKKNIRKRKIKKRKIMKKKKMKKENEGVKEEEVAPVRDWIAVYPALFHAYIVRPSVTFLNSEQFSHYCSCPTVRDWIAVYPALLTIKEGYCYHET